MSHYDLPEGEIFLVSQKALIIEDDKLLLLHRRHADPNKPQWGLPGGLLEMDESLENGWAREVKEETDLTAKMGKLFAAWDHSQTGFRLTDGRMCDVRFILLAYVCAEFSGTVRLSEEHDDYVWACKHEVRRLDISEDSKCAVDRWLESSGDIR
jgi:ADP-ribose pyrophosphatase YjhB (NUDIX family)